MELVEDYKTSGGTTSAGSNSTDSVLDLFTLISEKHGEIVSVMKPLPICKKPFNMSTELYTVYKLIMRSIPKQTEELKKTDFFKNSNRELEVMDLPEKLINLIARYSEHDVGELYYNSPKRYSAHYEYNNTITIKELFLTIICELGFSFKLAVSKHYIERIIYNSPGDGISLEESENGISIEESKIHISDVRLSKLIKHRFIGDMYSIDNKNCNKVYMNTNNKIYFFMVGVMCKFLNRKGSLHIDYVDFLDSSSGESIVEPLDMKNFHHSSNDIYYYNIWKGSEKYNDKNNNKRNSLMCILSFIKYKMNDI